MYMCASAIATAKEGKSVTAMPVTDLLSFLRHAKTVVKHFRLHANSLAIVPHPSNPTIKHGDRLQE